MDDMNGKYANGNPWLNASRGMYESDSEILFKLLFKLCQQTFCFSYHDLQKVISSIKREAMRHNILIMFFPY